MTAPCPTLRRRALGAGLATIVAALTLAPGAAPAAALNQVTCVGTQSAEFSPGLTNATRDTTVTSEGVLASCLSLTDPTVISGSWRAVLQRDFSCLTLLGGGSGDRTFRWSNGRTSTFTYNSTVQIIAGQPVVTQAGAITKGEFAGSTAIGQATLLADLTRCTTLEGLTHANGPYVFNIVL